MQSKEKDNIVFIRLFLDEDLNSKLKEVCQLHSVKSGVVLSGIGQIKNIKLGYFKEKGDYSPEIFDEPYELLSLTGNICEEDDDYILHLHAVIGDEKKNVIGGHFIEGKVEITCEIVLLKVDIDLKRKLDEKTGLKALYLE